MIIYIKIIVTIYKFIVKESNYCYIIKIYNKYTEHNCEYDKYTINIFIIIKLCFIV